MRCFAYEALTSSSKRNEGLEFAVVRTGKLLSSRALGSTPCATTLLWAGVVGSLRVVGDSERSGSILPNRSPVAIYMFATNMPHEANSVTNAKLKLRT